MAADWARPVVAWSLGSVEPQRLRAFYSALFNWNIGDGAVMVVPAGVGGPEPGPGGHILQSDRTGFTLFVQVRDLRETLDRAVELGGRITAEPFDLGGGQPTLAGIEDPEGNGVMLVQQ